LVKSKTEGAKNKGRKAHGQIAYLTLIFTRTELPYRFSSLKFLEASLGWGLKNKKKIGRLLGFKVYASNGVYNFTLFNFF